MDENRYPASILDLHPDYVDDTGIFESPKFAGQAPKPYIYLAPQSDSSGNTPPRTIVLISQMPYPRGERQVGYADGTTGFVHEKDLPDLKNHSPAN